MKYGVAVGCRELPLQRRSRTRAIPEASQGRTRTFEGLAGTPRSRSWVALRSVNTAYARTEVFGICNGSGTGGGVRRLGGCSGICYVHAKKGWVALSVDRRSRRRCGFVMWDFHREKQSLGLTTCVVESDMKVVGREPG